MASTFATVILDQGFNRPLDYSISDELLPSLCLGMKVQVPLRGQKVSGTLIEIKKTSEAKGVKEILSLLPDQLGLAPQLIPLARWISSYYLCPLGKVLRIMIPASVRKSSPEKLQWAVKRAKSKEELICACIEIREKFPLQAQVLETMLKVTKEIFLSELLEKLKISKAPVDSLVKKKLLHLEKIPFDRSLTSHEYFPTYPKKLSQEQSAALCKIENSLQASSFKTHLLHGITGSGKTEVYLQAIETALKQGKGVIVLVPEIALTHQTIERFRSRLQNEKIGVLHHRLSDGERMDTWKGIFKGEINVVIGARSAIFSPVQKLGLIIVDEEHESSYKQSEESPCYHARDVAVMRGKLENVPVVLGSATPSLESYLNAKEGKYELSSLSSRHATATLPKVSFVDMNLEFEKAKGFTSFSDRLINALEKRIAVGEQSILFLNRRGYHTALFCPSCAYKIQCRHCAVSLTYHKGANCLTCHLCGFTQSPPPSICPFCKQAKPLKYQGVGTELVEKQLHAIFPNIRTLRMDADTTKHKGSHQNLYLAFATGKADVLIGTQMIAKGLHFPQVTLVGVLNGDAALHIPDFRASENTFQMITQVAGRAGRGAFSGEVIIQTCLPGNRVLQLAADQNFPTFFEEEIESRRLFHYPPLTRMIKLTFSGKEEKRTAQVAELARSDLQKKLPPTMELGPIVPCLHVKVKDTFRFQCLLCHPKPQIKLIETAFHEWFKILNLPNSVKLHVDVNPSST